MYRWTVMFGVTALACCVAALLCTFSLPPRNPAASHDAAAIAVDLSAGHPVSPTLFGAFFEEIGHAGEGGLYAEKVQDRSFDALALTQRFPRKDAADPGGSRLDLPPSAFGQVSYGGSLRSGSCPKLRASRRRRPARDRSSADEVPVAWTPLGAGTRLALTSDAPLGPTNPVALQVTADSPAAGGTGSGGDASGSAAGVANSGFWGISVQPRTAYAVSVYLKLARGSLLPSAAEVALVSANQTYALVHFEGIANEWQHFQGRLAVGNITADSEARLAVSFRGGGSLLLDVLSLFPEEHVLRGGLNPWPFRADLLRMLLDLRPRFLRFPGGCYVEGDTLEHAFHWKQSIGLSAERLGHWNLWGYWSTDGLGLYEYMQLAEALGAEPVWVINAGVSHAESVQTADIGPWVQDALDSVEFVSGPADSEWGRLRVAMGHPEPWALNYIAIGNEDCGKPFYVGNYIAIFAALRVRYPRLRLVANCDMGAAAPMDLYDWHVYTDPAGMFKLQTAFDGLSPQRDAHVFASEYAVTTGGGHGNLIAAIAEAGFMTGLERNSEVVEMASYAPLLVHARSRGWPTDLIVFDAARAYGIPSYHVQRLFALHRGSWSLSTVVKRSSLIAASATCDSDTCMRLAVKVVNMGLRAANATIALSGLAGRVVGANGTLALFTGDSATAENTFEHPLKVAPSYRRLVTDMGNHFRMELPPLSLSVVLLETARNSSAGIAGRVAVA